MNDKQKQELETFLDKLDMIGIVEFYKDVKIGVIMNLFNRRITRSRIVGLLGGNSYRVIWNIIKDNKLKVATTEEVEQNDG